MIVTNVTQTNVKNAAARRCNENVTVCLSSPSKNMYDSVSPLASGRVNLFNTSRLMLPLVRLSKIRRFKWPLTERYYFPPVLIADEPYDSIYKLICNRRRQTFLGYNRGIVTVRLIIDSLKIFQWLLNLKTMNLFETFEIPNLFSDYEGRKRVVSFQE